MLGISLPTNYAGIEMTEKPWRSLFWPSRLPPQ